MPAARIWTIGHSTRSADEFVSLLQAHQISRLADIRTIPKSRRHPHFGGDELMARLQAENIEYRHFAGLGGLRKPSPASPNGAWRNAAFRGYADYMLTPAFATAIDELLAFGGAGRATVMCAEALWWKCHRMLLADALVAAGTDVEHILGESSAKPHRLTPFARIGDDRRVWYPALI